MEIIAGTLRGLEIRAPEGMTTRPTSVRSRKALFDSLGDLSGMTVADLFAGSGALGIEAASRGAETILFADASPRAVRMIRSNTANAAKHGCSARFEILHGELPGLFKRLAALPAPDLVFADPPYAESMDFLKRILADPVFAAWSRNAVMIWEAPSSGGMLPPPEPWKLDKIRLFGAAKFLIFKNNSKTE